MVNKTELIQARRAVRVRNAQQVATVLGSEVIKPIGLDISGEGTRVYIPEFDTTETKGHFQFYKTTVDLEIIEMPVSLAVKIAQVIADDTAIAVVKEGIANG